MRVVLGFRVCGNYIIISIVFTIINTITLLNAYEIISNKDNLENSVYLRNFISGNTNNNLLHPNNILIGDNQGEHYFKMNKTTTISNKVRVNLPKSSNSFVETLEFFVDSIRKDNKILIANKGYGYNITYSMYLQSELSDNIGKNTQEESKGNDFDLTFKLKQPEVLLQNLYRHNIEDLVEVVTINHLIFGIRRQDRKLRVYYYQANDGKSKGNNNKSGDYITNVNLTKIFHNDLDKSIKLQIGETKFTSILIDSNWDKTEKYLLLTDDQFNVYIFKTKQNKVNPNLNTNTNNNIGDSRLTLTLKAKFYNERLKNQKIVDFVEKAAIYYIGYDQGLAVATYNQAKKEYKEVKYLDKITSHTLNNDVIEHGLYILDLQRVGDYIYLLIKDYGIRIIHLVDEQIFLTDFEFYHPYLLKFDLHLNPYYKYPFLGVLVDNGILPTGHEFILEFSLEKLDQPLLYRTYFYDEYIKIKYLVSDERFTYIFEHYSNSLLVVSRSSTATGKNSIYKFQIPEFATSDLTSPLIIFRDDSYVYKYIGMISRETFVFTEPLEMKQGHIDIKVNKPGNYEVNLVSLSDYCDSPKDKMNKCRMYLKYNITAIEGYGYGTLILIAIVVILILLGIFFLVVICNLGRIKMFFRRKEYIKANNESEMNSTKL